MDVLTDEHEREEVVRKWWHEHWKPIALGVVIALAGLVGVRQYQAYQLEENQKTALAVYQLQSQLEKKGAAVYTETEQFINEHHDIYGSILALDMAISYLNGQQYAQAAQKIEFAMKNGGDLIAPQASLVMARLQGQQGNYNEAMRTLAQINSTAYKAEIAEVRGDLLMAQDDREGAHQAYQDAISARQEASLQISPILQMKFDNVIKSGDTPAYKLMNSQEPNLSDAGL